MRGWKSPSPISHVGDEYVGDEYVGDEYVGDEYVGDEYVGDEYVGDEKERLTLEAMRRGEPLIYCDFLESMTAV